MAKSNVEALIASIKNAGQKTASALKTILSEMDRSPAASRDGKLTARERLTSLLDEGTFSEIGAYVFRRNNEYDTEEGLESVICGWGSIDGQLVYCFAQDYDRAKGAVSEAHARKIREVYRLAMENGAPIVGVFDSAGAVIPEGVKALAGYSTLMSCAANASGVIPQIAVVPGICAGSAAVVAAMFDFLIITEETGAVSVNSPFVVNAQDIGKSKFAAETGLAARVAKNDSAAMAEARRLVSYLPSNNAEGTVFDKTNDSANRFLADDVFTAGGDVKALIGALADNGEFIELYADYAPSVTVGLLSVGGTVAGVIANNHAVDGGKLTIGAARKASRFLSFLDSFNIPAVTILDSEGPDVSADTERSTYAAELAKLASVYASARTPLVTLIAGEAYGATFSIMGSKAIGADVVYALEDAKIGALSAKAAVAFLWNDKIEGSVTREELEETWNETNGSPAAAAAAGEIDDIITLPEARQHIAAAIEMLASKSKSSPRKRHANMPL